MFKTIKSKIFLIVLSTLSALIIVFLLFSFIYFENAKKVFIDANYLSVSTIVQSIDTDIARIEDNARDMAIFGEVFYNTNRKKENLDKLVMRTIADYSQSLSGGVWYLPYKINPLRELFCSYVYMNKNEEVLLNTNYETKEGSYLKSDWYKDLIEQLSNGVEVAWSAPYYEPNGTQSYMVTAGVGIYDDKHQLVGISTADWGIDSIIEDISKVKPTQNSFLLFADLNKDFILVSTDKFLNNEQLFGKSLKNIPWYNSKSANKSRFVYHNKKYIQYITELNNKHVLIVNVPENELYALLTFRLVGMFLILAFFSVILCFFIYLSLDKNIIAPINKLIAMAQKISRGETDILIKIDKPVEFAQLASSFDKMMNDLKLITAKQTVIDSELMIAKSIQTTSLPRIFPPYPEKNEFDIYASMFPAKEVGGDFYDFYFIGSHQFMFLIADVSGKGIPAALFMMTVKTLINNISQTACTPEELIQIINKKVCDSSNEGFFVTLFAGIVDTITGDISCINCGHNPPLIKRAQGEYDFLKVPSNLVLGAFPDTKFEILKMTLNPGDKIFLYTDGVTEALNPKEEMFGEENLQRVLNESITLSLSEVLQNVYKKVKEHKSGMEQSDDITMLVFEYKGCFDKKEFREIATKDNYQKYYQMLYGAIFEWQIDEELAGKIYMCAEEVYANVTNYAYKGPGLDIGYFESEIRINGAEIILTCIDEGAEYNPLEKEDPDINLPPEERPLGGLGIFMIKNMTDEISYSRIDGKNVLTLKFKR